MAPSRKTEVEKLWEKGIAVKTLAVRKFIKQTEPKPSVSTSSLTSFKAVSSKQLVNLRSSLKDMSLKEKRDSEMREEIKHVRIQTPLQPHVDCIVQRVKPNIKRITVGVLRPVAIDDSVHLKRASGLKLGAEGSILPHSVLGDVETFIRKSEHMQKAKSQEYTSYKPAQVVPNKTSSTFPLKQFLNDEKALSNWDMEMFYRKLEQKHLSKIVDRPIRDLLMTRSDDYVRRNEVQLFIQQSCSKFHPDACFWKQEPQCKNKQIRTTLTKSERGCLQSPMVSGYAQRIIEEKGCSGVSVPNSWFESEYLKERSKQMNGVIHIHNKILFKELEVHGLGVYPSVQDNYMTSSLGASPAQPSEGIEMVNSSYRQSGSEVKKPGPSLCIDGTTLSWIGTNKTMVKDRIAKEVFILIQADIGKIVKGHMTFENNGTVVLKYFWKKEPVFHPLPVRRPVRRPFYCIDNAGSIAPGEIIHVPVLFKSPIAGYFTESWLLDTSPVLEGGAKIRFTLKGITRSGTVYSRQCKEVKSYITGKQIVTLCHLEAKFIVDCAILKASQQHRGCVDEPIYFTREELFEKRNPGLYFHEYIVKELWILFEIAAKDTDIKPNGETDTATLCISTLRNMILNLPCPVSDDMDEHYQRINHLFNTFSNLIKCLSFRPMLPWQQNFSHEHMIMYSLMQHGMDEFVKRVSNLTETLDRNTRNVDVVDVTPKVMHKSLKQAKVKITAVHNLKSKDSNDPFPTNGNSRRVPDNLEIVQNCSNTTHRQTAGPKIRNQPLYEEKTYLMMYEILLNTFDTFHGLCKRELF